MTDIEVQKVRIEHIQKWQNALQRIDNLKRELNGAECDLKNAETALGMALCPKDAVEGETFSVWTENRLINVTVISKGGNGTYQISWRK